MVTTFATLERRAAGLQRQIRDLKQHEAWQRTGKRTPLTLAAELGIRLDGWQQDAVMTELHDILLLVSRQGGKGLVASLLALDGLVNDAGSTTVIVSRAERQAKRLLRRTKRLYRQLSDVSPVISESQTSLELRNGSEIIAVPGTEETIRGLESVHRLLIDEGALVSDELFAAVQPMTAVVNGRIIALSTARGKRGWFYREYVSDDPEWHRTMVTAYDIPRLDPVWLERTRNKLGDFYFRQEFLCEFLDDETQLYATDLIDAAVTSEVKSFGLPRFGGNHGGLLVAG